MASGSVKKLTDKPRAKPYRVQWREHPNADKQYRFFKLKSEADDHLAKVIRDINTGTYFVKLTGASPSVITPKGGVRIGSTLMAHKCRWSRICVCMCTR
jgi:hypothetical protein